MNLFLNIFLKKTLKIPRPESIPVSCYRHSVAALQTNNGMPSDHMQFMGFFATYVILWLYKRYARGSSLLIPRVSFEYVWQRVGATVFIVLLTASIFISRYISLQDALLAIASCWGSTTSTSWLLAALLDALPVLSGSL